MWMVCTHVYVSMYMCMHMYTCICICVYVYIYVIHMCIYIFIDVLYIYQTTLPFAVVSWLHVHWVRIWCSASSEDANLFPVSTMYIDSTTTHFGDPPNNVGFIGLSLGLILTNHLENKATCISLKIATNQHHLSAVWNFKLCFQKNANSPEIILF